MSGKIFINYRRGDSAGYAGRIGDWLQARFGSDQIFIDVTGIDAGEDFVKKLGEQLAQCDAMLSIIGPAWETTTGSEGIPRIEDPNDFVRLEIETALEQETLIIPVLVDRVSMPVAEKLPEGLRSILSRNAIRLRHESFDQDMEALAASIRRGSQITTSREREEELLKSLRMQLLSATSARDIRRSAYELDRYLSTHPNSVQARLLKDHFAHVLSNTEHLEHWEHWIEHGRRRSSRYAPRWRMLLTLRLAAILLVSVVAYLIYRLFVG